MVDGAQPAAAHTAVDRSPADSERVELPARDDAVLALCKRRDC